MNLLSRNGDMSVVGGVFLSLPVTVALYSGPQQNIYIYIHV